jgi:hypothetical protein
LEQLGRLGFIDYEKQLPLAKVFHENIDRLVELLTGSKMTDLEEYQFRLSTKALSDNMKSDLQNLGTMGYTNLDKNIRVLNANKGAPIEELFALLS